MNVSIEFKEITSESNKKYKPNVLIKNVIHVHFLHDTVSIQEYDEHIPTSYNIKDIDNMFIINNLYVH